MNYLDRQQLEHENSLSYPDKLWVVMDDGNDTPVCFEDRYEAETYYHSMQESNESVRFGYCWDGSISGRMPYKEVDRIFKEVRI